jgi:hypothetical protein
MPQNNMNNPQRSTSQWPSGVVCLPDMVEIPAPAAGHPTTPAPTLDAAPPPQLATSDLSPTVLQQDTLQEVDFPMGGEASAPLPDDSPSPPASTTSQVPLARL